LVEGKSCGATDSVSTEVLGAIRVEHTQAKIRTLHSDGQKPVSADPKVFAAHRLGQG
jgi:hypothetical protein